MHLASRARSPALFSTALMDETCPPSTIIAAYNYYAGPKQIKVWPYNNHEGGETSKVLKSFNFLPICGAKELYFSIQGFVT